ncbi:hypothetical protein F4810DRAFT_696331 [Camillea tinctor]|nr:hypothetical protein F4810DRAFT_696331 [Camillea tinctor]
MCKFLGALHKSLINRQETYGFCLVYVHTTAPYVPYFITATMSAYQYNSTVMYTVGEKPCRHCQMPIYDRPEYQFCTRTDCQRAKYNEDYRRKNPVNNCENCGTKLKKKDARWCNIRECQRKAMSTRGKEKRAERLKKESEKLDRNQVTNQDNAESTQDNHPGEEDSCPNLDDIIVDETPRKRGRYQSYAGDEDYFDEWEPHMNSAYDSIR